MTRLENFTKYIMALLTALIVAALYAPIIMTIFFSFYKSRKGQVDWNSFSYDGGGDLIYDLDISKSPDIENGVTWTAVSYTHLTLPTKA